MLPTSLNEYSLVTAAEQLAARDKHLRSILVQYGPPPLWARPQGFPTLVRIILEQQVSLASAASLFARLKKEIVPFRPERFIELGPDHLKTLGLTRQKTAYLMHLAECIVEKRIHLSRLQRMSDEDAKAALIQLKGIGTWTADIYLLMALLRPDVWPANDLALAIAMAQVKKLNGTPKQDQMLQIAEKWRPFRSVAARMLWQLYLAGRNT